MDTTDCMDVFLEERKEFRCVQRNLQKEHVRQLEPVPATCQRRKQPVVQTLQKLVIRGSLLFMVGVVLSWVFNLLQVQRNVTKYQDDFVDEMLRPPCWVPPSCGAAAAIIGLLYPALDNSLREPHKLRRDWSSVMRNLAFFVGINHASTKIEYSNNLQLSLSLAAMSIGLWWLFDRSKSGFGLGCAVTVLATLGTQLLVYYGVYRYTEPDFLYIRSWLPSVFFSGGVTMGNIGRQLAMYDYDGKLHID